MKKATDPKIEWLFFAEFSKMVSPDGFEPSTLSLKVRCSTN